MLPATETDLILENTKFLSNCAWSYIREAGLPSTWFDDVFQEAAIAYIQWYRRVKAGEYNGNGMGYARTAIRFHLQKAFLDRLGIGITYFGIKKYGRPTLVYSDDLEDTVVDEGEVFYPVYFRDWASSLTPAENEALTSIIETGKASGNGVPRSTAHDRKKNLQRSYGRYFDEAG